MEHEEDFPPGFEWDPDKSAANEDAGDRPTFREAATALADPYRLEDYDADNSEYEHRTRIVGLTSLGRVVTVVFTLRGQRIRIISARFATPRERSQYEDPR